MDVAKWLFVLTFMLSTDLVGGPDVPQPSRNVSVLKCSKTLLTWDKPAVVNEQPQNTDLKYEISINSSKGNRITFTAREAFAVLPVGEESNEIVRYNVCVSAVNCVGVSEATCIITALGGDESLLSPELNVSAFNSSTVELTWNHRRNITDEEVCYNIEKDYTLDSHCILGNKLIVPMEKGNLIHTFRVRAITERITGEWSNPICIVFSVPLPLLFKNYTVHRDFNTTTVTMAVRVQQLTQFVENCRIFPATKIELFNSLATISVNLDEGISEQEVSLHFKTISGVKRTEVTGRVFNHVGVSFDVYNLEYFFS